MSVRSETTVMNPYPGLRPFREEEEYLFFGREKQVDVMVDKLSETHFLSVVGTSGSGKSSLVNCGLRPALHRGLMASAGTAWRMAQFRPGKNPLRAMAEALSQDGILYKGFDGGDFSLAELIETSLRMSKLGLIDVFQQARLGTGVNLLLVVDQFEELFRYQKLGASQTETACGLYEEATTFVNLMLEVPAQEFCQIYVVLTMRSDFLGDCAQFFGLPETINKGQYLVPRMSRSERKSAILGPSQVMNAEIEPILLTRLVNDVGDNPDQLSILQHALNRTWARYKEETGGKEAMKLQHYEAIGTMSHALNGHAEEAFDGLGTERRKLICEKIFKALTDKGTDPRGIRRPTELFTLCALAKATEAEVIEVIDVFREPSRSFLMPPAGELLTEGTVIDISHESLMRVWDRLNTWGDEETEDYSRYKRILDAALWQQKGGGLLQDPDLQLALNWWNKTQPSEAWTKRNGGGFDIATKFLNDSKTARKAQRHKKQLIYLGLTTLVLLFVAVVGYTKYQTYQAQIRIQTADINLKEAQNKVDYNEKLKRADVDRESGLKLVQKKNFDGALKQYDKAMATYIESGEKGKQMLTLIDIGRLNSLKGNVDQAKRSYEQAREIAKNTGNRDAEGAILESLASMSEQNNHLAEAHQLYNESLKTYLEVGNSQASGRVMEWLAIRAEELRDLQKADEFYQRALISYSEANDRLGKLRLEKALTKRIKAWGFLVDLQTTQIYDLRGPKISVGRSISEQGIHNDISFSNRLISRRHIDIQQDGTLEDLRSRNGTTINGRLLPYGVGAKLKSGDIITLASIKVLQFRGDRPVSVPNVPAGTWAVFIDSTSATYHYLAAPEYSLVMTNGKLAIKTGLTGQALMRFRWQNGKAEMYKVNDDWIDRLVVKESDYEYKKYRLPGDLPADRWLELVDLPQEYVKRDEDGKNEITKGPAFQVVLYKEPVLSD